MTGESLGGRGCCADTGDTQLSVNGTTATQLRANSCDKCCWYVACFSTGMKVQCSTPKEMTLHFSPVTPQRVNESPVITPLVCIG
jgi:hypothetical protein